MPRLDSYAEADSLRDDWAARMKAGGNGTAIAALSVLLRERGTSIATSELRFAFRDMADPASIPATVFHDHAIPVLGSPALRHEHAFSYLGDGAGAVATELFAVRLVALGLEPAEADAIVAELDRDGDALIELHDVRAYLGDLDGSGNAGGYRASHVAHDRIGRETAAPKRPVAAAPKAAEKTPTVSATGAYSDIGFRDLQIGFFRLLQGAAYRSFRESYSAHSETHLRARDLPYTLPDFAAFVRAAVEFYLALGLVEGAEARREFDKLARMVADERVRLDDRIATWGTTPISAEMAAAEARIAEARATVAEHRHRLADALERALVLRMHAVPVAEIDLQLITQFELNRLRHMELAQEHGHQGHGAADGAEASSYLDVWAPVILSAEGERPDGAIMPVRFWYERFMPQLLRCASIRNDADLATACNPDPEALAAWHRAEAERGAFDRYATDLRDGFDDCTMEVQQALAQAWHLTAPYLNGLEKRREREEFGRDTGALSQYVAFIDVYLGRSDIADAGMRVSFPYYIGPAVWCFLHTAAELVEAMEDDAARATAVEAFKRFFRCFATMYPCPYCRYHLNRFVVSNRELNFYPMEFMLLGQRDDKAPFDITLDDRLDTIDAARPGSLRLFLWKLHNAVSSSIARTEPWYHREVEPLYTTRFWPGLDAEIAHAHAMGLDALPLDRIEAIYAVLKPAAHLSVQRKATQEALAEADGARVEAIAQQAQHDISELEGAIERSAYLSRTYHFDPQLEDADHPAYSVGDEAYARSGLFVER